MAGDECLDAQRLIGGTLLHAGADFGRFGLRAGLAAPPRPPHARRVSPRRQVGNCSMRVRDSTLTSPIGYGPHRDGVSPLEVPVNLGLVKNL